MLDLLALTIVLPLLGAGGIFLLSSLLSRLDVEKGHVKIVIAAVALIIVGLASILVFGSSRGRGITLSSLYPSVLAESAVEMRWDARLWPLGLSLCICTAGLLLSAGGRKAQSFRLAAVVLLMLATGLASLWSANPLTTIVCWAFYDLVFTTGLVVTGSRKEDALRSLALGSGASLFLWVGVLVAGGGIGSVQWQLIPPDGTKVSLWMLAGLLRLGAYPLHFSFPRHMPSDSPLVGAFYLSPVLGWGLWIRLALISDQMLPVASWMIIPAMLTLAGGAVLGWTANPPQASRSWISLGGNGALLLATVLSSITWNGSRGARGETVVAAMTLGAMGWMLGTSMLFLGGGVDFKQSLRSGTWVRIIPSIVGALSLIGAPATVGFVAESGLLGSLVGSGRWGWAVSFAISQVFLVAAVVRWLRAPGCARPRESGLLAKVVSGVGMIGLAVSAVFVGVVPGRFFSGIDGPFPAWNALFAAPGLAGWLLWGGAVALGGMLAWGDKALRPRISLWLDAVHDIVLLDWAYDLLIGAVEQGFALLRVLDDVVGGRGAFLWAGVILLILILVSGG